MRKAASIARGAWSETLEPTAVLISREMLITPVANEIGSIRRSTRLTRGSRRLMFTVSPKPSFRSRGSVIRNWATVPARTAIA
jgi:hypothetical protein